MKKILFSLALLVSYVASYAGTAKLSIYNTSLCTIYVTMYAQATTCCGGTCNLVSNVIAVPPGALSWSNAYDFELAVGWASLPSGTCSTSIGIFTPADFQWSGAHFDVSCSGVGCYAGVHSDIGDSGMGCTSTLSAWSGSSGCVTTYAL